MLVTLTCGSTIPSLSISIDTTLLLASTINNKVITFDDPSCAHVLELDAVGVFDPVTKIGRERENTMDVQSCTSKRRLEIVYV